MPAVNGILTPPPANENDAAVATGTKRKRSESKTDAQVNGANGIVHVPDASAPTPSPDSRQPDELQSDLLTVLRRYAPLPLLCKCMLTSSTRCDTQPSILDYPIASQSKRSSSSEPSAKKPKTGEAASVGQKLEAGQYASLDELEHDVDFAAADLLKDVVAKQSAPESRMSLSDTRLWTAIKAFQEIVHGMVHNESQRARLINADYDKFVAESNGIKQENHDADDSSLLDHGKKVLTIFANPNGARQLFSSSQRSYPIYPKTGHIRNHSETVVEVTAPLAEASLPHIISTTIIPQLQLDASKPAKSRPTLGEAFPPPASLPQLHPPRHSKQLTTKGSTISFISNETLSKRSRRDSRDAYNWVNQPLTVGQWLGWGGVDPPQEPTSPEAKRRQRDRALSTGEAKPPPSLSELRDIQKAKDDALFRKVYSSFAPSRDNSGAVVPEAVRNQVWWNKVGQWRARHADLLIDPVLLGDAGTAEIITPEQEAKEFEEAVRDFEPEEGKYQPVGTGVPSDKDVDDILTEITDMIETLYSHQLIRNASLATISKTPVGQNTPLTELTGSPDTPSAAEVEHYKLLRSTLVLLVSQLPPYAVARLDGDKLKELNVSTKFMIETSIENGVMEEDQVTRIAKQNTLSSVTQAALNRGTPVAPYSSLPASAAQYSRGTPLQPGSVQRGSSSYYPHQQPPTRATPSVSYSRSSSGLQQLTTSYPNSTPRTGYPPQQQYASNTTQRPSNFPTGANHYLQQLQSFGKTGYNQQYAYSQNQNRGFNQQTPVPNYQQRAQATPSYGNQYPQSPYQRTASPLNAGSAQTPQFGIQARANFNTPASSQTRSQYMPPSQNPNSQQQAAIERQRAEIAAQTSARLAAATGAMSPGSQPKTPATPQQSHVNGA